MLLQGPEVVTFLLLGAYLFANSFWALDSAAAFGKAGAYLLIGLCGFIFCRLVSRLPHAALTAHARALALGWIAGLLVVLAIAVVYYFWGFFPIADAVKSVTGGRLEIEVQGFLDKNAAMAALLLMPALLALRQWASGYRKPLFVLLGALAILTTILSDHDSSRLAALAAVAAMLLARYWPAFTRRALLTAWCLAFVLFIPLAMLAFNAGLHKAPWLPDSAKARVILWEYTARQIPEAPILGVGIRSTRILNKEHKADMKKPEGFVYPLATGRHSHSLFVQSWYELGAIGAFFVMLLGAALIWRIGKLPGIAQPYALGTFAAFFGIAAFAWGMFQTWLMAAYALLAILLSVGVAVASRGGERPAAKPESS